jgi:hypothetical protein
LSRPTEEVLSVTVSKPGHATTTRRAVLRAAAGAAGALAMAALPAQTLAAEAARGRVNYNGHRVSDATLRRTLQQIADHFRWTINVTSGDRDYVPPGGSPNSLHLKHRAADFHVAGASDGHVFWSLHGLRHGLLRRDYEVIWHGPHTQTTGPHVHLGRYGDGRASKFMIENGHGYQVV